ncbi:MAG: hypothetical protein AMXMBFR36_24790 [Acidobacteriota bacterium]
MAADTTHHLKGASAEAASARTIASRWAAGARIADRYRVVGLLGRGGGGEVYEVEDLELREHVALKTLPLAPDHDEHRLERLRRELALARRVTHPNVCRLFDFGHCDGEPADGASRRVAFLTMELLRGPTLAQRLAEGRMLEAEALPIVRQLAAGVDAAHAAGVVHRDLKASNVMLVDDPQAEGGVRAVVTDFGLARVEDERGGLETLTGSDVAVGTPSYMSPEQVEGGAITAATDVYSFGILLYEMVTGRLPFEDSTPLATAVRRLREAPAPPRSLVPELDPRWNRVILRCLERRPEDRYAGVGAAVAELGGATTSLAPRRRRRLLRGAAILLPALAVALVAWLWTQRPEPLSAARAAAPPSVAALDLVDVTGGGRTPWLGPAVAEMLATELSTAARVRIVPRAAVEQAARELELAPRPDLDRTQAIGRLVGAAVVLGGTYLLEGREAPRPVRLDLRLYDAASGEMLLAFDQSGREDDLIALVEQAGARLRRHFHVDSPSPEERRAIRAALPSGAQLEPYISGLELLRRGDAQAAVEELKRAVELAPDFPLASAALARAYSDLGQDDRARAAAQRALDRSAALAREEQILVEALYRELHGEWRRAADGYRALREFHPDEAEFALLLAAAETAGGEGASARSTLEQLRVTAGEVMLPRLELELSRALRALGDLPGQRAAAERAAEAALAIGAPLRAAEARLLAAEAARRAGDLDGADRALAAASAVYEAAESPKGTAAIRVEKALIESSRGDYPAALELARRALSVFRDLGDRNGQGRVLHAMGDIAQRQGRATEARARYEEALVILREAGNQMGASSAYSRLGILDATEGNLAAAQEKFEQALERARRSGNLEREAAALNNLAVLLSDRGEMAAAERNYEAALVLFRRSGLLDGAGSALNNLAILRWDRGELAAAADAHLEALALYEQAGDRSSIALGKVNLAEVRLDQGRLAESAELARDGERIQRELGETLAAAKSRAVLAMIRIEQGELAAARPLAEAAAAELERGSLPDDEAFAWLVVVRAARHAGDAAAARSALDRARASSSVRENPAIDLALGIEAAELAAASESPATALPALREIAERARAAGIRRLDLAARLASARIEQRLDGRREAARSALTALAEEAAASGFHLVERHARRALDRPH